MIRMVYALEVGTPDRHAEQDAEALPSVWHLMLLTWVFMASRWPDTYAGWLLTPTKGSILQDFGRKIEETGRREGGGAFILNFIVRCLENLTE